MCVYSVNAFKWLIQVVPAPNRFGPGRSGPSLSGPKLKLNTFELKYTSF